MARTFPFWAGASILTAPASIMVLSVLGALPRWVPAAVFVLMVSLPVPAAGSLVAGGLRSWSGHPGTGAGVVLLGGVLTLVATVGLLGVMILGLASGPAR